MTPEQEKEVTRIGQELQGLFPDMHGSIRFNLMPGREKVNVNIDESKQFDPKK